MRSRTIAGRLARAAAGLSILSILAATAAMAADPKQGEVLARRWCAACHIVASDQTRANPDAPPFATIAGRPDFDPDKLATFLLDPHPKMPDMGLTPVETGDLAAYVASLKR